MQIFKIKLANLIQNDIKAMTDYYENQIKSYIDTNIDLQKINTNLKQRIYSALVENDDLRKNF